MIWSSRWVDRTVEHGIGRLKVDDLESYSDPETVGLHAIKGALDPQNI